VRELISVSAARYAAPPVGLESLSSASFWRRALYTVWLSQVEMAIRIEQQQKYFLFQLLQVQTDIYYI
jgi:hypothetical protein